MFHFEQTCSLLAQTNSPFLGMFHSLETSAVTTHWEGWNVAPAAICWTAFPRWGHPVAEAFHQDTLKRLVTRSPTVMKVENYLNLNYFQVFATVVSQR